MAKNNKNLSVSLHCKERYVERFGGVANNVVSVINKAMKGAVEIDSDRKDARRWLNRSENMIIVTDDYKEIAITVYKWKKDGESIPMIEDKAFLKVVESEFLERTKCHYIEYYRLTIERERLSLELHTLQQDMLNIWLEDVERFRNVEKDVLKRMESIKSELNSLNTVYNKLNSDFSTLQNNVGLVLGRNLSKESGKLFFLSGDNNV